MHKYLSQYADAYPLRYGVRVDVLGLAAQMPPRDYNGTRKDRKGHLKGPERISKGTKKDSKANHQSMQLDAHKNSKLAISKLCAKGGRGKKPPSSRQEGPKGTIQGFILLSVLIFAVFMFGFRASATDKHTANPNGVINSCFIIERS